MMELFPAILIGGPPHSGKSVLAYSLTQALRTANIDHYLLRACPDGEGDWANEADQATVRAIRVKGEGTPTWVEYICRDIANRHLPLLVDVGGKPTSWQELIFGYCTHAILLSPEAGSLEPWRERMQRYGLSILAEYETSLTKAERVWSHKLPLRGILHGLERGTTAHGPAFAALLEKIKPLFSYQTAELRQAHLATAPVDNWLELQRLRATLGIGPVWQPTDLPRLLDYLPAQAPLAIYDRGPNWLYAALAWHSYPAPLYQFDPRLGWVKPPELGPGAISPDSPLLVESISNRGYDRFKLEIQESYLDYLEALHLTLPPLHPNRGLILDGKLPLWLWTALVRRYRQASWLGVYQPQLGQAVVVGSTIPEIGIGQMVEI